MLEETVEQLMTDLDNSMQDVVDRDAEIDSLEAKLAGIQVESLHHCFAEVQTLARMRPTFDFTTMMCSTLEGPLMHSDRGRGCHCRRVQALSAAAHAGCC